jgi:hypothetical protein
MDGHDDRRGLQGAGNQVLETSPKARLKSPQKCWIFRSPFSVVERFDFLTLASRDAKPKLPVGSGQHLRPNCNW